MGYSILLDLIAVAIIFISAKVMTGHGILKSLYKIFSLIVVIAAVGVFMQPAMEAMSASGFDKTIDEFVFSSFESNEQEQTQNNIENLPEYFETEIKDRAETAIASAVSNTVKRLICSILIFIACKLILFILFHIINGVFKLPLLRTVNKTFGFVTGIVSGLVIVYILCGIIAIDISHSEFWRETIDNTFVVKYFYDINILMNVFL